MVITGGGGTLATALATGNDGHELVTALVAQSTSTTDGSSSLRISLTALKRDSTRCPGLLGSERLLRV